MIEQPRLKLFFFFLQNKRIFFSKILWNASFWKLSFSPFSGTYGLKMNIVLKSNGYGFNEVFYKLDF
jgi:hypothetical protein